jgi:hypothetical protein
MLPAQGLHLVAPGAALGHADLLECDVGLP